ncbi:iron ABC transporter permease [Paenibacillus sp. OV219]|uniref:FecCD family ABC transporter permease n=1 Tax=Paenibacillus sp. OV219 TaxID=1884377 RepID=UPI0008B2F95B|nr:iron ABC transporter permease [Paenibacillus sp. OV219]SEM78729.1 iron complex transport system permease protein [Paenibacillus sp. OV219]
MVSTSIVASAEAARRKRAFSIMTLLFVLIVIVFIISMDTGQLKLTPHEVLRTLIGKGDAKQELILFQFRLPRMVMSLLIGAAFAVSGCILQGVTRNALAEPGILGINAGAGLVVILFISVFPVSSTIFLLPLLALVGAGGTAALIFTLSYRRNHGISTIRMLLVGIAVAAGISAAMLVLTLRLNPEQFKFVQVWLAGSILGTDWRFVLALVPWLVVLLPLVFFKARVLDVMNLGDLTASGLGAALSRERLIMFASAVGLAGAAVALGGAIGFVGLIGPHLARRLVGPQHPYLLPASALAGALLLIISDTFARLYNIPTGIVVAVIGAPYFLYLLMRTKGSS